MTSLDRALISPLTGLRAIAAYMVFFHHFPLGVELVGSVGSVMQWQSHVGVSVFFVLSGFLISYNYSVSLRLDWSWYRAYLRNRFARIYPVYFLATVLALLYLGHRDFETWFMNLSLLRGFFREYYFYHIGQAWSLTVEMTFYLLVPCLILLVGRIPVGVLCLFFYGLGLMLTFVDVPGGSFMSPPRMVLVNTFFGRCFEFLLGIWLFKRYRNTEIENTFWASYMGVALLIGFLYVSTFASGLTVYSPTFSPAHHFIFPLIVALLIYGLWKEKTLISRFLASAPLRLLGRASYAFYLFHAAPFKKMLGMEDAPVLVHFVAINILAIAVYLLVEKPLQRLLRSSSTLVSSRKPQAISAG